MSNLTRELQLREQYDSLKPLYLRLEEEVKVMVTAALENAGRRTHSLTSRVKGYDSVTAKLESKGLLDTSIPEATLFYNIDDMVGVRIVALFRNELSAITDAVVGLFDDCLIDDKIAYFETSVTGYQSIHITACLPHDYRGHRYDSIKGIRFEVQIRTIAMDAWANISHHLNYKTESDVPADQRRSFRALAGLFYVADTEFQVLNDMRQQSLSELTLESERKPESILSRPVTADALLAYLRSSPLYRSRERSNLEAVQSLAEQLREAGYTRLSEVNEAVLRGQDSFREKDNARKPRKKFTDVGRIRISVRAVDPKFHEIVKRGVRN